MVLPTESQWEYAARAGRETPWFFGKNRSAMKSHGNIADESAREAGAPFPAFERWNDGYIFHAPVGQFDPNGFGFHDMLGNVAEWCRDFATKVDGTNIATKVASNTDPLGTEGDLAVCRGGAYNSPKKECRTAARSARTRTQASPVIGFRPALVRR